MHAHTQLLCSKAGFAHGPQTILHDVSLVIAPGDRLGIVGANGTGKTTLLRLLAGELAPDAGSVTTNPPAATVGLLTQLLDDEPGETVGQFLLRRTGVSTIIADFQSSLQAVAADEPGAGDRYDLALTRYINAEAATFDEAAERTMSTAGLSGIALDRPTAQLSGGQRTRINLTAIVLASFDVLLLDEPTNDLDLDGLELLEDMVLSQDRPVVLVSHDRTFLERVVTSVYELDEHTHIGSLFNGGFEAWQHNREIERQQHYDDFAAYNAKRSQLQNRAQQQQQWSVTGTAKAKKDKSENDKFIRAHRIATSEKLAGKAKQTERALERLERNEKVEAPWEPWELQLNFEAAGRSGSEVAALHGATVQRGSFRFGPVDVVVTAGDRVLVTGENGAGKTTLLQALLGELDLTSGTRHLGPSVKVATLSQGRELFAEAPSLIRGFTGTSGCDDQTARSQLAKLGLDTDRINRHVHELSPGERTRAALGLFAHVGSNLLVFDEPTNHLDLPAIEQLEQALAVFPHSLLLVTHDRRLVENVTTNRHWHLANGQLTES